MPWVDRSVHVNEEPRLMSGAFESLMRPRSRAPACATPGNNGYALMSTSLVSGRKISATTKLIVAITIGYHSPE
jgi:hypothetical protein